MIAEVIFALSSVPLFSWLGWRIGRHSVRAVQGCKECERSKATDEGPYRSNAFEGEADVPDEEPAKERVSAVIRPYSAEVHAECPSCGLHRAQRVTWNLTEEEKKNGAKQTAFCAGGTAHQLNKRFNIYCDKPHLVRACSSCGFEWLEATKDKV